MEAELIYCLLLLVLHYLGNESHIIAISLSIHVVCIFVIAARNVRGHYVINTGFTAGIWRFYFYIATGIV